MKRIREAKGHVSFYYAPLDGGNIQTYNPDEALIAASVIKIPVMVEAFRQMECGMLSEMKRMCSAMMKRNPPAACSTACMRVWK